jgi:hypothetical protein
VRAELRAAEHGGELVDPGVFQSDDDESPTFLEQCTRR